MAVRLPRLLDASLNERARLHPVAGTLNLVSPGVPEATQNLPPEDVQPAIHDWEEIYNQNGSVGFYRVTGRTLSYTGETVLTLRHGIDTLSDSVYNAQQEYDGPVAGLLTAILDKQTTRIKGVKPWQLGTCADNTSIKRSLNYDNLKDLFNSIEEEKNNYYFSYDMTTWPWTVSFLAKPTAVAAEFRLNRNIQDIQVSMNDSELCTRLYLAVNVTTTTTPTADEQNEWPEVTTVDSEVRRYDNREAQDVWGIVVKTASIDTDDDIQGQGFPSANAWAARYMRDHAEPTLQIQISGQELKQLTGDGFDEAKLGSICRVTLPDHDAAFSQRIVAVSYPDLYGAPDQVNVSLANKSPKVSTSISQQKQEAAKAASTAQTALRKAGGGGGGGGAAKELESWAMICKKVKEAEDATGLTELYESGIVVDAQGGVTLHSLTQGFISSYAELKVNSQAITAEVQRATANEEKMSTQLRITADGLTSATGRLTTVEGKVTAIEGSTIWQRRNEISALVGKMEVDEYGHLIITDGAGLRITEPDGAGTKLVTLGTYTNDMLDAGVMVQKITTDTDVQTQAAFGTYMNGKLDAGVMVNKIVSNTDVTTQATFGVYVNGKLDAGVVVDKINDDTDNVQVAARVNLGSYATVTNLNAVDTKIDNLMAGSSTATYLKSTQSLTTNATITGFLLWKGVEASWLSQYVVTGVSSTTVNIRDHDNDLVSFRALSSNSPISGTTIYYMGHL